MTVWIGVFGTANGWRVARPVAQELYVDRNEAIGNSIHRTKFERYISDMAFSASIQDAKLGEQTVAGKLDQVDQLEAFFSTQ